MRSKILLVLGVLAACADAATPTAPVALAPSANQSGAPEVATALDHLGILRVRAYIDGRSRLILDNPHGAQWQHFEFAAPGRLLGANFPTMLNDVAWYPDWGTDGELRDCGGCYSGLSGGRFTPMPWPSHLRTYGYRPRIRVNHGRGAVTEVLGLGVDLALEFNDNTPPGAAWYEVDVDVRLIAFASFVPRVSRLVVRLSDPGVIQVALLYSIWAPAGAIDPLGVDPRTVFLGNQYGVETAVSRRPDGQPRHKYADVDGDGELDLVLAFSIPDLVAHGDLQMGQSALLLSNTSRGLPVTWPWVARLPILVMP